SYRIDVKADVALLIVRQHGVDRCYVGLLLPGLFQRRGKSRPVALMDDGIEPNPPVKSVTIDDGCKQRQERRVGAKDTAVLIDPCNRHWSGVEEAREPDLGSAQIGGRVLALGAVEHNGPRRPMQPVAAGADAVHEANRKHLSLYGGEIQRSEEHTSELQSR